MITPQFGNRRALTIMELLVVIAVIGTLAALIVPVINGLSANAASVNCMANMRQLGAVLHAARLDHDGYFPIANNGKRLVSPHTDDNRFPHAEAKVTKALRDGGYLHDNETPLCPAMRLSERGMGLLKRGESPETRLKKTGSYALNIFLLQVKPEALSGQDWLDSNPYPGDSKMPFLVEKYCGIGADIGDVTWAFDHPNMALDGWDSGTLVNVKGRNHGGGSLNFLFLDGHIARITPKIRPDGKYDWTESFDRWGREGKYINPQNLKK